MHSLRIIANRKITAYTVVKDDQESPMKHLNTGPVTKQMISKPLYVEIAMDIEPSLAKTEAKNFLYFDPDPNPVNRWCQPAKALVKLYLISHSLYSSLTVLQNINSSTNIKYLEAWKITSPIVSTDTPQISSQNDQSLRSVVAISNTEKESSILTFENQKTTNERG